MVVSSVVSVGGSEVVSSVELVGGSVVVSLVEPVGGVDVSSGPVVVVVGVTDGTTGSGAVGEIGATVVVG